MPAAYPAQVADRAGKLISHGRTTNISESGMLVICNQPVRKNFPTEVTLTVMVPGTSEKDVLHNSKRAVRYLCRVARIRKLGQLVGLGLEFVEKSP